MPALQCLLKLSTATSLYPVDQENELTSDKLFFMTDNEAGSVTAWLHQLHNGNANAAQQALWERYFQRLATIARTKLPPAARRAADEEDIALSVLDSFFRAANQGRYPDLKDRTELWPLLARIAVCKAANQTEREVAAKRGGGRVRGDSGLVDRTQRGFDDFPLSEPTPDAIVELNQLVTKLMDELESETLREVARMRLSGYTNLEIAQHLDVSQRTVERKLLRVRAFWLMKYDK